jgi:Co/Zn/Cd efflux system component
MGNDCCDVMDLGTTQARQRRILAVVLAINVATFALMVVAGIVASSTSLLGGSLDNLGDSLTYALSLAVVGATHQRQSRVALVKGLLILGAAAFVAFQIAYRIYNPSLPIFETMGVAGLLNLAANGVCLWLLTPYRGGDVNMQSAWECSRNDILEGIAVLAAAGGVWVFDAGWPDLAVASVLLALFVASGIRVLRRAASGLRGGPPARSALPTLPHRR